MTQFSRMQEEGFESPNLVFERERDGLSERVVARPLEREAAHCAAGEVAGSRGRRRSPVQKHGGPPLGGAIEGAVRNRDGQRTGEAAVSVASEPCQ